MKILVAGLGLIGGSYCKAISSYTSHEVYGYDLDTGVIKAAEECGCIIQGVTPDSFGLFDMIIVGLHPDAAKQFMNGYLSSFKKGAILADVCGIKGRMTVEMTDLAARYGVCYV